ncbi:MAG: MBL fold metallo-hydrolase [Candidatus Thorarchaeota archaeon]|jgi:glyoxylase-like metal-dependent hydrolase (beta-lactamase superfamily II)
MPQSVRSIKIIRSGTTLRDDEVWAHGFKGAELRKLEERLGTLTLSTIILVKTAGVNILIDTSWEGYMPTSEKPLDDFSRLTFELQCHGLKPSDIDEIFVTHWHGDHYGNIPLFPRAKILFAGIKERIVSGYLNDMSASNEHTEMRDSEDWYPGIRLMTTHGHSDHDHSVIIQYGKNTFVAAGDSIVSKMYYDRGTFFPNTREQTHLDMHKESFRKIVETADYIIPGHDGPFFNYRKGKL